MNHLENTGEWRDASEDTEFALQDEESSLTL